MLPDSLAARGSCDTLLLLRHIMKFARWCLDYLSLPNTVSVELLTSPLLPEILLPIFWKQWWCGERFDFFSRQFVTTWWRCWVWRDSQCHPIVEPNPWDFLTLAAVTTAWPLLGFLWWWPSTLRLIYLLINLEARYISLKILPTPALGLHR